MISQIAAFAALSFFTFAMIFAALQDAATLTISNRLVLLIAGAYVVFAPLAGFGIVEMGLAFGTGALVLALTFTLFAFGMIGGGDAKFAAATALWLGPEATLAFLIYTMLIGGALALAMLTFRAAPLPATFCGWSWVSRLQSPGQGIPYALAMSPAAILVIPTTTWFALVA
jgi:prepilin peptidase CpaA